MKKFLSIILVALLLVTAIVPAFADGEDVVERLNNGEVHVRAKWDSYNYVGFSMVEALNAGGYYKGEDGTGVQGTEPLTRWQFCLIMLRAMTGDLVDANWVTYLQEYGEEDIVYDDVRRILNMTYEEQQADPELFNFYKSSLGAILFMMHNKYIIGSADANGEINLRPNDTISFTEAVTIVVRMLGWNSTAMNYNYPQNYLDVADEIGVFGHYEENGGDPVWVGLAMDKIGLDDVVTYEIAAQLVYALWTCNVYDNELGEIVDNPYAGQLAELEAGIEEQLKLQISSFEMGTLIGAGYEIFRNDKGTKNLDDPQNQPTILRVKDSYALPGAGVVSVKNGTTVGEIIAEFIDNEVGDKITAWNFGKYYIIDSNGADADGNEMIRFKDITGNTEELTYAALMANSQYAAFLTEALGDLGGVVTWKNDNGDSLEIADLGGEDGVQFVLEGTTDISTMQTKKSFITIPTGARLDDDCGSRLEINYNDPTVELEGWDLQRIAKVRIVDYAFWSFFELDENNEPIYASKMPALVLGTVDRGSDTLDGSIVKLDSPANAWTNYAVDVNTTLAREFVGDHDTVLLLHNGDEWYGDVVKGNAQVAGDIESILDAAVGIANLNTALELGLAEEDACEIIPIVISGAEDISGYVIEVLANTKNADPEMKWNGEEYAFGSSCSSVKVVNSRVYTKDCLAIFCFDGILADLNAEFGIDYWWSTDEYQGAPLEYDGNCELVHLENKALETIVWGMDTDANGAIDYIVWGGFQAN